MARRDLPSGTVHYYFSDDIGSTSIVTNGTGSVVEEDLDYYPYGGIVAGSLDSVPQNYKFNGKERDAESGLDNFGARYNASSLGRFMTPDWAARPTTVPYAVFGDPQSLNLYGYVRNDPVSHADADGHSAAGNGPGCGEDQDCFNDLITQTSVFAKDQDELTRNKQKEKPCRFSSCVTAPWPESVILVVVAYGHHGYPVSLFRFLKAVNPSAYRWLNNKFVTGPLASKHYYDAAHREYNEAIRELLKLNTEEGQQEVARDVLKAGQKILDSDNPAIKGFLDNMKTTDGMTGREALGRALEGDGQAAGEFINGAIGELVEGAAELE